MEPRPRNMPPGFKPPYEASIGVAPVGQTELILAVFGVSGRHQDEADIAARILETSFAIADGPAVVEWGLREEPDAAPERIAFAYWLDSSPYNRWLRSDAAAWFQADPAWRTPGPTWWRETSVIPLDHFESSYSATGVSAGFSKIATELVVNDVHAYWGAARDRIPASDFASIDEIGHDWSSSPRADRLMLSGPDRMCMIRTSQDWTLASADQKNWYETQVAPTLAAGVRHLAEHPEDSECYRVRFIREVDEAWRPVDRTCVLAYFSGLKSLERWTHSHPTHLAIFARAQAMLRQFSGAVDVRLWHEVAVLPQGSWVADYPGLGAIRRDIVPHRVTSA